MLLRCAQLVLMCLCLPGLAAAQEVKVGGSGVGSVALQHLAQAYMIATPGAPVRVVMPPLGTVGGLEALSAGLVHLIVLGRQPTAQEATAIVAVPWVRTPFALVARDAPLDAAVTASEVNAILRGEKTKWSNGQKIRLVLRPPLNPDTPSIRALAPEIDAGLTSAYKRVGLPITTNDVDNQKLLDRTPGAFGAMAIGHLQLADGRLTALKLDGVEPTLDNLRSGRYPHEKQLYLSWKGTPLPSTQKFILFLQSDEAQRILAAHGFAPLVRTSSP